MTEMPRTLDYLPLSTLEGALVNPKGHAEAAIEASITRFGYVEAITLDERTGRLVAGHGRLEDLRRRESDGEPPPEGLIADDELGWLVPVQRGWQSRDDAEAEAYLIASNRTTELGGWDDPDLEAMTARIAEADRTLLATFTDGDDDELLIRVREHDRLPAGSGDDAGAPEDGELLALTHVTLGEPITEVHPGQVWRVGPHHLVVGDVMADHSTWAPLLTPDALFVPYPGPYVALIETDRPLVMVQPERYIAGHLLDKYAAVNGADSVELL